MTKKIKHLILLTTTIISMIIFFTTISIGVFGECNPLIVLNGFINVSVLNNEYYEIQEYPKIIIANKDLNLVDYMKNLGWQYVGTIDENKSVMKKIHEFKIKDVITFVEVIEHKNFYIWKWRE